jgi:acetate---CoA ligase (ADP-forming)
VSPTATAGHSLDRLFSPRAVAVVGASADPDRLNGRPVRYLLEKGFAGRVYPINPNREEILGVKAYPSLTALPEPPDVAYVLLPAAMVPDVADEAGAAGVPFLVVTSSGFSEVAGGEEGQRRLVEACERHGVRLVGPNCEGLWNTSEGVFITFGSAADRDDLRPGAISIVSQSGSLAAGVAQNLVDAGLGVGYFTATGNEAGLDVLDLTSYLVDRDDVRVVLLVVEGLKRGERLVEIGQRALRRDKVILALKTGRSEAGRRANASHSGKIATSDALYAAAMRQAGILRLDSFTELREAARVFDRARSHPGRGLAAVSISGGARALIADACERHGLPLPEFAPETRRALAEVLPAYAIVDNPADVTGEVISSPELLAQSLEIIARDSATDAVMLQLANLGTKQAADLVDLLGDLCAGSGKQFVLSFVAGLPSRDVQQRLADRGVLYFDDPASAVRALGWLHAWRRSRERLPAAAPASAPAPAPDPPPDLSWESLGELLERFGVAVAPSRIVAREDEIEAAVGELGLPLVAKVPIEESSHKTEAGGVRLGLRSLDEVSSAFRELAALPDRRSTRVHLQAAVGDAVEVVAAVRRDPDIGPVLAVGPGGVLVELVGELAHRVLPVPEAELEEALAETPLKALLAGFRGRPPADVAAVVATLTALQRLLLACPWLQELEINPLMVLPAGRGAVAVDIWAETGPPASDSK